MIATPSDIYQQQRIVEQVDRCRQPLLAMIKKTDESVVRLRELRSALITAAVTGQIDVATWGKGSETDRRLEAIEQALEAELEEAAV